MTRRARSDRGAVIVEAAFVLPVMMLMMLAMINIGLVILGNSVGTNAARDGARIGIIQYLNADIDGTTNRADIDAAVLQRLAGHVDGTPTVEVRCLDIDTLATKSCNQTIQVGRDLLEVEVTWNHVGGSVFVAAGTHTATARLTIVGDVDLSVGTPPPLQVSADSPTVVEGNPGDNRNLVFTVTRSYNTTAVTISYTTANGSASSGDYTATTGSINFPANGSSTFTVTVPIVEDTAIESSETVLLNLSTSDSNVQVSSGTGTITNDDLDTSPPVLSTVEIRDGDSDGKLDLLIATFNEALNVSFPGTWTFSDASGGSVQSAAVNGSTVQVILNEGAGFNTGPTVTVSGSGTRDAQGNAAGSQSPSSIIDAARPRVVGLSSTVTGTIAGRAQAGDTVRLVMSEAVTGAPASVSVVVSGGNPAATHDSLSMPTLTSAAGTLGRTDYMNGNRTATFANSAVAVSGVNITVTLGATCTGSSSACANLTTAANTGTVSVSPHANLRDAANNQANGPSTFSVRLF